MSEDRRQVYLQLETLREEYDCLKAIQSSCVTDYQAQLADMRQVSNNWKPLVTYLPICTTMVSVHVVLLM